MRILKDQHGLTIVELVSSFTITMVALVFLFNIVVILKENYVINSNKSDLIVEQSLISRSLNEDLYNDAIEFSKVACPSNYDLCYEIGLEDGTVKDLNISYTKNEIMYGDLVLTDESFDLIEPNTEVCYYSNDNTSNKMNSFLKIKVDFDTDLYENYEFGINVVFPYSNADFIVNSNIGEC